MALVDTYAMHKFGRTNGAEVTNQMVSGMIDVHTFDWATKSSTREADKKKLRTL